MARRKKRTPRFKSKDRDIEELRGLKSGQKTLWLNLHRSEVLSYLETQGDDACRRHYGITTPDVLDNLKGRWDIEARHKKVSEAERLRTKVIILEMDLSDTRKEVRELKEQFSLFRDNVGDQLTKKFFIPLMKAAIKLSPELEELEKPQDPLNVQYIMANTDTKEINKKLLKK